MPDPTPIAKHLERRREQLRMAVALFDVESGDESDGFLTSEQVDAITDLLMYLRHQEDYMRLADWCMTQKNSYADRFNAIRAAKLGRLPGALKYDGVWYVPRRLEFGPTDLVL